MPLENIAKQENRGNGILKYTEKTTGSLSVFLRDIPIINMLKLSKNRLHCNHKRVIP